MRLFLFPYRLCPPFVANRDPVPGQADHGSTETNSNVSAPQIHAPIVFGGRRNAEIRRTALLTLLL